jgi:hypothetical protein
MAELIPEETREPLDGLESAIVAARDGELSFNTLIGIFAETTMIVPSTKDFREGADSFQPITFPFDGGDGYVMAVFTAQDRTDAFDGIAPFQTALSGRQILGGLQPGVGIIVNPGTTLGFELDPAQVPTVVAALDAALKSELTSGGSDRDFTALERAILANESGTGSFVDVLASFESTGVFVPTRTAPDEMMDELDPILLDNDGIPMLAVFTDPSLIGDFSQFAEYVIEINGGAMAEALTSGTGIVINPNRALTYVIEPAEVAELHSSL